MASEEEPNQFISTEGITDEDSRPTYFPLRPSLHMIRRGSTSIQPTHTFLPLNFTSQEEGWRASSKKEEESESDDDKDEKMEAGRPPSTTHRYALRSSPSWAWPLLSLLITLLLGSVTMYLFHSLRWSKDVVTNGVSHTKDVLAHTSLSRITTMTPGVTATSTKTPKPSASQTPSISFTNAPLAPCSCASAERKWQWMLHMQEADSRDDTVMGTVKLVESKAVESGVFGFSNVLSLVDNDPAYPSGRSVVLDRPLGRGHRPASPDSGPILADELNKATAKDLMALTHPVAGQDCHKNTSVPQYFAVDTSNDQDAGEWLGESALFLNTDRWGQLLSRHPGIKLVFKSPAPHKSAFLQLMGIPESMVTYLASYPCDSGNRVYLPPFARNAAPGWSQHWWKRPHTEMLLDAMREKAGYPSKCPSDRFPPKGLVYVTPPSSSGSNRSFFGEDTLEGFIKSHLVTFNGGGSIVRFPDTLPLKFGEIRAFVAAIATARVVVLHASSAVWIFAGLARGATVIVLDSPHSASFLNIPGHVTERAVAAQYNTVTFLGQEGELVGEKLEAVITEIFTNISASLEPSPPPLCSS